MGVIVDSLQHRRNRFARIFAVAPALFLLWLLLDHFSGNPVYARLSAEGPMFWVLSSIAFVLPIIISILLLAGVRLEHFPPFGAVLVLAGMGIMFALLVTDLVNIDTQAFIEVFLSGTLLLAYSSILLLVRKTKPVHHFLVNTEPPLKRVKHHHRQ